jgi:hypothetical protein
MAGERLGCHTRASGFCVEVLRVSPDIMLGAVVRGLLWDVSGTGGV